MTTINCNKSNLVKNNCVQILESKAVSLLSDSKDDIIKERIAFTHSGTYVSHLPLHST